MRNKWDGDYLRVARARYKDDSLLITFRNGDEVSVAPRLITENDGRSYSWPDVSIDRSGVHVMVPTDRGAIQIPSHFIRRLTDADFAKHAAVLAERQARIIGQRLRELRERRGISQAELARRAGIQQANLSRIEGDQFDVATSTLWKLLAAMGYEPADLSPRSDELVTGRARR